VTTDKVWIVQNKDEHYDVSINQTTPVRYPSFANAMTASLQLHRKHTLDIWIEDRHSTRLLLEWKPR
jgi:hypothetical protein